VTLEGAPPHLDDPACGPTWGPSLGGAPTASASTRASSILPCGGCSQILHPEFQHLPDLLISIFASPAQTEVALFNSSSVIVARFG
jgi:hypothetical protein